MPNCTLPAEFDPAPVLVAVFDPTPVLVAEFVDC